MLFAIAQVALALGSKNPSDTNWQTPAGDDQSGNGVTYISTSNRNCGVENTKYQCHQVNQDASVTNPQNLTITCDKKDLCSLLFDFEKEGNIASFSVNCLSSVGKPIGSSVNVELYGKRNFAPVGTV